VADVIATLLREADETLARLAEFREP
jgi:hypothetical protein